MQETFAATLPFFALILCGYLARWWGVMGTGSSPVLNNFVLYFALPALFIRTLAGLPFESLLNADFVLVWAIAGVMIYGAIVIAAVVLRQLSFADGAILALGVAHGNIGYLGITLVVILLGPSAVAAMSMAVAVDFILFVPLTLVILELSRSQQSSKLGTVLYAARTLVANPFVISIFLGLSISYLGIGIQKNIDDFLNILGMAAVPTALFALGVTLYGQPLGSDWVEIGILGLLKLLVHPLLILGLSLYVLELPSDLVAAATLLAALPIANNVFIIATHYDTRVRVISGAILVSTTLALVSFNIWASFFL